MTISQERFSEKMDELDRQNPGPKEQLKAAAIAEAAALLRAEGWTCVPRPSAEIPRIEVGQVWTAPSARVEPRTVTSIAEHRSYPWAGDRCIYFTTPTRKPEQFSWGVVHPVLDEGSFMSWARRTGRPAGGDVMGRRYSLPVKRRFHSKWWKRKDRFVSRKVSNMICALRNPYAGGGWSGETGDGEASYSPGPSIVCPWCFVRGIRGGYWAGPWKRVRREDL